MDKPAGHYSVFRVPFQIDADGDCTRCGLKIEPDEDTLEPHECPPGFTEPAMSRSKPIVRYTVTPAGLQQADDGEVVLYADHREKVDWLLRLKGYAQQRVETMYRSYLRACEEVGSKP